MSRIELLTSIIEQKQCKYVLQFSYKHKYIYIHILHFSNHLLLYKTKFFQSSKDVINLMLKKGSKILIRIKKSWSLK